MGSVDIDEVLVCLAELFNLVFTVVTSAPLPPDSRSD